MSRRWVITGLGASMANRGSFREILEEKQISEDANFLQKGLQLRLAPPPVNLLNPAPQSSIELEREPCRPQS